MSKRDYYEALGVARNATEDEIKRTYRRLAMKYHPDRNQHDTASEEKFKEIKEAYEVLSDGNRRAMYDRFGHAGADRAGFGGMGEDVDLSDVFGDVFGAIFGGGRARGGRSQARRGNDLYYSLEITLEEAAFGKAAELNVSTAVTCGECEGSGAAKNALVMCTDCHGEGQVRMQHGFFTVQQTCPTCQGKGRIIKTPCSQCRGQGRLAQKKTLSVKIPAGVATGDQIRLSGEGEAGPAGAQAGDLYVQIQVKEHALFQRDGQNLYTEIPVSFITAALGSELEVPALRGRVKLKIPPETQTGTVLRIKGQGISAVRGQGTGDLFYRVQVEIPINLTAKQKELLKQFDKTMSANNKHTPQSSSWFNKVKKFFEGS